MAKNEPFLTGQENPEQAQKKAAQLCSRRPEKENLF
jgi:hypothetical protein